MSRLHLDENNRNVIGGVDSDLFATPTPIAVNSSTHAMLVEMTASSSVIGSVKITDGTDTASVNASNQLEVSAAQQGTWNIGTVTTITNDVNTIEKTPTTLGSGQQNVTTAGTRVQLASNTCLSVTVKAKSTNAGLIFVGDESVNSSNGFILSAGEPVSYAISNTNKIYIDSSINGDGVSYSYVAT